MLPVMRRKSNEYYIIHYENNIIPLIIYVAFVLNA